MASPTVKQFTSKLASLSLIELARLLLLLLSASAIHAVSLALSISGSAVKFLDTTAFFSISIGFYGAILASAVVSTVVNQFIGAEFAYKSFRRDRDRKVALKPRPDYVKRNNKHQAIVTPALALLFLMPFYFSGTYSILILLAPVLFLSVIFFLHVYWADANSFRRKNQSHSIGRWLRIWKSRKLLALSRLGLILRLWIKPRIVVIITLVLYSSGSARLAAFADEEVFIKTPIGEIEAAVIFRNSTGVVLVSFTDKGSWFLTDGGVLIPIKLSESGKNRFFLGFSER